MVSVVAACAWWVGASQARSVERIDERGLGPTIIYVNHRNYMNDSGYALLHADNYVVVEVIRRCREEMLASPAAKKLFPATAKFFSLCMRREYIH
jgi:hypothetical protein